MGVHDETNGLNEKNELDEKNGVYKEKCDKQDNEDSVFDTIMKAVGNNGKFQKRFAIWFNFIFVFLASMPYFNFIIALSIPDHWCTVPGKELTNFSLEDWKTLTIPTCVLKYINYSSYFKNTFQGK